MSLTDLFVDAFPLKAGTTASDALWTGVPVPKQAGQAFASRMAASLLHAIGQPELVSDTGDAHQNQAIRRATEPAWLRGLHERLMRNRETHALLDAKRFCPDLKLAYRTKCSRYPHIHTERAQWVLLLILKTGVEAILRLRNDVWITPQMPAGESRAPRLTSPLAKRSDISC